MNLSYSYICLSGLERRAQTVIILIDRIAEPNYDLILVRRNDECRMNSNTLRLFHRTVAYFRNAVLILG